jgi:dipeptidyl aminopeptidase/acylaminoacyl peptidase
MTTKRVSIYVLAVWLIVTVLVFSDTLHAQTVQPLQPLPAEAIFKRAAYDNPSISPDGKYLAIVVPLNQRRNLALIDIEKRTSFALTNFADVDVSRYEWVADSLLEVQVADMSEATGNLWLKGTLLLQPDGKVIRRFPGARSGIVDALDREGKKLLVFDNSRTRNSLDAWLYNPYTNAKDLLTFDRPAEVSSYVADHAGNIRFAISIQDDGKKKTLHYRESNAAPWRVLHTVPGNQALPIIPLSFLTDNKTAVVRAMDDNQQGRRSIYLFNPDAAKLGDQLHAAGEIDAGTVLFDRQSGTPKGVRYGNRTVWFDAKLKALQEGVDSALKGTVNTLTWADYMSERMLVNSFSARNAGQYYLLDRTTGKMEELVASRPWLKPEQLADRRVVTYNARDGLKITAHLTLPNNAGSTKPPLLVDIHGGPFVYGYGSGFNPLAQYLASRGIAVLQPDFRGTLGYGQAFTKAGWKQYGLAMQDDITDGVNWLIEQGKVDPNRVCLMGGSYGGYATLMGLIKEPDMFKCGIAYVALADLELKFSVTWSDYMASEGYRNAVNGMLDTVGDPKTDRDKFRATSPVYQAARIKAPVLLAYGGEDRRVPLIHGQQMRDALKENNKPYEWIVYNDEAHGFNKDTNRFDFYRRVEAFLNKYLDLQLPVNQ